MTQEAAPVVEAEHDRDWGAVDMALGPHGAHVTLESSSHVPAVGGLRRSFLEPVCTSSIDPEHSHLMTWVAW